jgi:hypothetical protein
MRRDCTFIGVHLELTITSHSGGRLRAGLIHDVGRARLHRVAMLHSCVGAGQLPETLAGEHVPEGI